MQKNTKSKRSSKAGLPPGSLVHIGKIYRDNAFISAFNYNEAICKEQTSSSLKDSLLSRSSGTVLWVNIDGIQDVSLLEQIGTSLKLHPLVLEDIANTNQRPKVEDYGDYLYVVLRMLYFNNDKTEIMSEQVSLIIGNDYVLSIQEGDEKRFDVFESVRSRIRNGIGKIRKQGSDFLMYSLIDAIVDNYFIVLEGLDDLIEETEDLLTASAKNDTLKKIQNLKRQSLMLHKAIWPLREVVSFLQREDNTHIQPPTIVYLRDVYDHVVQLMDTTETVRDVLSGMLDIYLTTLSNRLNEVMKVLTIISTVFMPLSFIAGIYGMNFQFMPELKSPLGYPIILLLMLVIAVVMLRYFKKRNWF